MALELSDAIDQTRAEVEEARIDDRDIDTAGVTVAESPKVYHYPSDLHSNVDGAAKYPHSVIFYINARTNTAVGAKASAAAQANADSALAAAQSQLSAERTGQNRIKEEQYDNIMAGSAAIVGGTAVASTIMSAFTGDLQSTAVKTAQRATVAFGLGVLGKLLSNVTEQVRLLSAIELVTQTPPVAGYSASYDQEDVGAIGAIAGQEGSLTDMVKNPKGIGEYLARGAITAAASLPESLGVSTNLGAAIEATSKKVSNPYREQLFKNMEFRRHSFQYQFAPKNAIEMENIMQIIQLFKYHMHPERTKDRLFLAYPAEFQIEYRFNSEEQMAAAADAGFTKSSRNTWLSKIGSCVLENMKVTYGNADFVTIKGTDGAPAFINLELQFAETEILTNDRITQDYRNSF